MTATMTPPPAAQGSRPDAEQALQEALALHRAGQRELAMQRYLAILERDPENLDALYYLAVGRYQEDRIAEAIKLIERALAFGPPQGRLHNLLGQAHLRLRHNEEALKSFGRAVECEPSFVDAYGNRGTLFAGMGRLQEALADFDHALTLRPDNAEDVCNRAGVLADLGRLPEALAGFDRAIALTPGLAPAYYNRGRVLVRLGRHDDALADYDRTIALHPRMAAAYSNRGLTLKELGRLDEAKASLDRALSLDPQFTEAMLNRGNVAYEQGRLDEAQADYARALARQPQRPEANYGRALACLTQGDWETGFRLYEYRDRLPAVSMFQPLPCPRWNGEPLAGERLALLCEQGLGDMIQFSRFAPLLAARGVDVVLLAPDAMQPLLSTLKGVTVAGRGALAGNGRALRWAPLMSVPGLLGVRPETVPGATPYLAAEPARLEAWKARLGSDGFKIGINWGIGAARGWFSGRRAVPLAAFAPLAAIPGVRLISLQKGAPANQIADAAFRERIELVDTDPDPNANYFLDAAAVMMGLDLIVTCDTSVTHLAGALARPVFTALPLIADWRWLHDRDDTPWYPTMRLFRQTNAGEWDEVFTRIATAVAGMIRS